MATKKAKKTTRGSKEMLLVGSETKDALKGKKYNVSSDAIDALNEACLLVD
ncbi:MAG: hypothetical protein R2827_09245 [Bdellovibrionales bacterium]